jgi:hypothetical protein
MIPWHHNGKMAFGAMLGTPAQRHLRAVGVSTSGPPAGAERVRVVVRDPDALGCESAEYGLQWDHQRQVWTGSDGFAYDGKGMHDAA